MSSVMPQHCPEQRKHALYTFRELFFPVVAEAIFFGIYATLAVFSTIYLVSKKTRTRNNYCLMGIIVIMFAVAITHWTLHLILAWFFARHMALCLEVPSSSGTLQVVLSNIQVINFTVSDFIVIWRAWVLWGRPRWILVISSSLALLAAILASINLISDVDTQLPPALSADVGLTVLTVSALNNLWGTSLVAYKAWKIRLPFQGHAKLRADRDYIGTKALILVTESGVIYSIIWIIFICSEFGFLGEASAIVQLSMVQLTGIYPTIIISLIFLEKTYFERMHWPSKSDLP